MKKLLLLIIVMSCTLISYSQKDTMTLTDVYKDIKQGVHQVVNKLEGPAAYVFEAYKTKIQVAAIIDISALCLSLTFLILFTRHFWNKANFTDDEGREKDNVLAIIGLIATIITFGFSVYYIPTSIPEVMVPDYYAIQEILQNVNGHYGQ